MGKLLWQPSTDRIEEANMTKFIDFVNNKHNLEIENYKQLYEWSTEKIPIFWETMWQYSQIKTSKNYTKVVDDLNKFPGAKWFEGAKLNFAENLLRHRNGTAIIFRDETGKRDKISYSELFNQVTRLAEALRETGVVPRDRVCAYTPNLVETVVAMLAATSIGATWASCGAELGAQAALDRLGQIEPKILFTSDGYHYKGKTFHMLQKAEKVARGIKTLKKVVVIPYINEKPDITNIPNSVHYQDFLPPEKPSQPRFEQLPADQPLYIMFSSGTTGKPKCMVQGAAGILVNHLKELILHTDLKKDDTITYITSCSWMMWNWLLTSLAVGATIMLYDGNPNYPNPNQMWKLVEEEKITIFGCSASYINYLQSKNTKPGRENDLSTLKEISQTGSPLSPEGFEYVYKEIKKDIHFNSISGGTDINGCFAAGSPTLPVYAGQLQAPALGMKIKAYNEKAEPVVDQQGELVCEAPAPSMPLYFWDDPGNKKYLEAYFNFYPQKRVWRHGDYIKIHSDTGGITFYGRSDAVLKPSGVRIGTAEIYEVVEKLDEVADSLAIGQNWRGDQRIILFVKLVEGEKLTEELKNKIRKSLREQASPRHVPALILETPDIPYTYNMKKVEIAVTNILHNRPVTNRDALVNPESLDYYEKIAQKLREEE